VDIFTLRERYPGAFWIKLVLAFVGELCSRFATRISLYNAALRAFYRAARFWLGLLTFLFAVRFHPGLFS